MNDRNFVLRLLLPVFSMCPAVRGGPAYRGVGRLAGCLCQMNLWISLPLAIWLSGGWMGLLSNWRVLPGMARFLENSKLCEADR